MFCCWAHHKKQVEMTTTATTDGMQLLPGEAPKCSSRPDGGATCFLKNYVSWIWVFPKIGGFPPKWMVKTMENPMNKWMIWGETHYFRKHPYGVGSFWFSTAKKTGVYIVGNN